MEFKTYRSSNLNEHIARMKERGVVLRPSSTDRTVAFDTTFSVCFLRDSYLARSIYGPAMAISKFDEAWAQNHFLSMPVTGTVRCNVDGDRVHADARQYLLYPPDPAQHFETERNTDEIYLAIRPTYLRTLGARLLGRPVERNIRFSPSMSADAPHARMLRMTAQLCLNQVPENGETALAPFDAQIQEFIATTLLLHQPHELSSELHGPSALPAPRDVRRVIDYIQANLTSPIRLDDLITIANVPGRTLNEHFRRFIGLSPMAYLRRERFRLARRMLSEEPELSVTEIATACGFFHLGRFSVNYEQAFGESPSATLSRARRAS